MPGLEKKLSRGRNKKENKPLRGSHTEEEMKLQSDAVNLYSQMKTLLRGIVADPRGKNLVMRTTKGMGEKYFLTRFAVAYKVPIIQGPLRLGNTIEGKAICLLSAEISERQFGATVRALPEGIIVFDSVPRSIDLRILPILAEERSRGTFNGRILVFASETDSVPTLHNTYLVFEQIIVNALQTLAIARQETMSIAEGLTAIGSFHSRAMVRVWTDLTQDVLQNAAENAHTTIVPLSGRITLSISQFMLILKLFPLIYPSQRDIVTRKEWISENLGFGAPPFQLRNQPVPRDRHLEKSRST